MANKKYKPKKQIEVDAEQFNSFDYLIGKTYSNQGLVAKYIVFEGIIFKEKPGYNGTFYLKGTKQVAQDSDWIVEEDNQGRLKTNSDFVNDYEEKI